MTRIDMLSSLHRVEQALPSLLAQPDQWQTLYVDYDRPIVERVWCQWDNLRVYLHRILPCSPHEALFHPHPWPSAMRIVAGSYEMGIGYAAGNKPPPEAARVILIPGSEYEMTHPDGWHYVRPIDRPSLSLMVAGKPWNRSSPKSEHSLEMLSGTRKTEIIEFFRAYYSRKS